MNFDEAIKAHSDWKMKLSAYLRNPDGSLQATTVGLDNKCPLGVWIHGEGSQYASLPEYAILKSEHAAFHKAAAEVIRKADAKQDTTEDVALGSGSPFASSSTKVVQAIMKMRSHAG